MPTVKLNDVNIYYEIEGEGPWAIFVPGGGGTHLGWMQQVYAMRDRFKCLTYDPRGLGQSEGIEDSVNGDRELFALMEHLKIDKAFLNGHSAGGSAVSKVAQAHPERVHALIMTCCVFGFQTPVLSKWASEMLEKFSKGYTISQRVRQPDINTTDPERAFLGQKMGRLNSKVRPRDNASYTQTFGSAYIAMRDAKPVDYSKFNVPTLFVVGQYDELQVPWLVRGTADLIPIADIVEIRDAGHGPPSEQTGAYNAAVLAFMDKHDPRTKTRAG